MTGGKPQGSTVRRRDGFPGGLAWIGSHQLGTLTLVLGIVAGAWAFGEIADEVMAGGADAFDTRVLLLMRTATDRHDPVGPLWLEGLARDFTALGSVGVLGFVTLATLGFLVLQQKTRVALLVLVTVAGGQVLSSSLKLFFARPRPDLVLHLTSVHTASFPSGHAMMTAVTYLTLAALLARMQPQIRLKAYLLLLGLSLTLIVGITRVYLGVHWPTDVLAGWTVGTAWAMLCLLTARWLQHAGKLEPEVRRLSASR
jgi:undecaprenyl-diphosphatase